MQKLSPRQEEVLEYLKKGYSNEQIAKEMGISINTVKLHVVNICDKFGVKSRLQVVVKSLLKDK